MTTEKASRIEFILFVDEHGTIGSDKDSDPYGNGFLIAQKGPALDSISASINDEFPNGFHLAAVRGPKGKLRKAKRLISLLPTNGHFYCGGYIQMDPSYARDKVFNIVAGRERESNIPPIGLKQLVDQASLEASGLVLPHNVVPDVLEVGRLLAVYSHALRMPAMIALHAIMPLSRLKIDVKIGIVRQTEKFQNQIKKIEKNLTDELPGSLRRLLAQSQLPVPPDGHFDIDIEVSLVGANDDPLFGVADLFAGVTLHYERYRRNSDYWLGKVLYEEVQHILERSRWQPEVHLVPGIMEMKPW